MQSKLIIGLTVGFIAASAFAYAALSTDERLRIQQAVVSKSLGDKVSDAVDRSDDALASIAFTVATETEGGTNDYIVVAGQMNDEDGEALAVRASCFCYISSDDAGDSPVGTFEALNVNVQGGAGTDGIGLVIGTNALLVISESDGDFDVTVSESSTTNYYLCCNLPNGDTTCSAIIDFS